MSSSVQVSSPQPSRTSRSMPSSPNSLTMTANLCPPALASRCRTKLVLPAPRKPVTIVAGMRCMLLAPLQDQGQASGDEDDPVGKAGDLLVEPAGSIAKRASERRLRHQTQPDLVGDKHHRSVGIAQCG